MAGLGSSKLRRGNNNNNKIKWIFVMMEAYTHQLLGKVLPLLLLCLNIHMGLGFALTRYTVISSRCRYPATTSYAVTIREFQPGDASAIQECLLETTTSLSLRNFDPEGPLTVDCANDDSIRKSYMEDGVFLVAIQDDDQKIVGTAGLVIGTTVLYQSDGASRSTPAIMTGAIRRVCGSSSTVCQQLLHGLEAWIGQQDHEEEQQVQQLIVLAYPESSSSPMARPTSDLLERVGYERSETQLPRSNVVQYEKRLDVIAANDKQQLLL